MPQQALHYFGVVVFLPQQGRVVVAQCVPSLNFDPGFRGDWLDVMLHYPTHPIRLLASLLSAGEDVVAVLGISSLLTPSQQFIVHHILQWDALFLRFSLAPPIYLFPN